MTSTHIYRSSPGTRSARWLHEIALQLAVLNERLAKEDKLAPGIKVRTLRGMSRRAKNALRLAGIETVEELCRLCPEDVLELEHVGRKTLTNIEDALARVGKKLGGKG